MSSRNLIWGGIHGRFLGKMMCVCCHEYCITESEGQCARQTPALGSWGQRDLSEQLHSGSSLLSDGEANQKESAWSCLNSSHSVLPGTKCCNVYSNSKKKSLFQTLYSAVTVHGDINQEGSPCCSCACCVFSLPLQLLINARKSRLAP